MAKDCPRDSDGNSKSLKRTRPDVIEISSDEDGDPQKTANQHRAKIVSRNSSSIPPVAGSSNAQSILQNKPERYKLEHDRLARQRARELATNPPQSSSPASPPITPSAQLLIKPTASQSEPFQHYWNSAIKVTFNDCYPDSPNTLRIEDIIGPKDRIKSALVSSYVLELAWVHKLFNPKTRIMAIRHHADCGSFRVNERQNMFLCHPPMLKTANGKARPGCMHIKFFIIFYDEFCRVAIPTANAVAFDYEIIENAVWIQDFRPIDGNTVGYKGRRPDEVPPFRKTLDDLLERMGVPPPFRKPLEDYDFRTAAANLVVSIQGDHSVNSPFGQMRLAKELETLGLQSGPGTGRTVSLECQGSSIGSYDSKWLNNFYRCASGCLSAAGSPELDFQTTSAGSKLPLSVLYPSLHTVINSKSGKAGGGTLFCSKSTWEKANFPKNIFADTMSKRAGVLMHVKMILGLFHSEPLVESTSSAVETDVDKPDVRGRNINKDHVGFLYIGSHNFTPAAWGKFTCKSGSPDSTLLGMSNWELGVVLPVKSHAQIEEYVTWQRPPKPYGHSGKESSIPWMQFSHGC